MLRAGARAAGFFIAGVVFGSIGGSSRLQGDMCIAWLRYHGVQSRQKGCPEAVACCLNRCKGGIDAASDVQAKMHKLRARIWQVYHGTHRTYSHRHLSLAAAAPLQREEQHSLLGQWPGDRSCVWALAVLSV